MIHRLGALSVRLLTLSRSEAVSSVAGKVVFVTGAHVASARMSRGVCTCKGATLVLTDIDTAPLCGHIRRVGRRQRF